MLRRILALAFLALPLLAADKPAPPADLTNPPADAERAESGLITKRLTQGTGTVKPASDSLLRVRYTVWKEDGSLVQHVAAPQTVFIGVPKMIPGWGQAAQQMVVGETRRAWIPKALNGGKLDLGLVIDTELLEVVDAPVTPADVAAPPADATVTESGLAYKVLRAGTGIVRPRRSSSVEVHYSGWSTDGVMFDSSVRRGQTSQFRLDEVIKGWTEGLQLMVEGEKTRFWIPAKLAYANDKSRPQGMLVFDIELVDIK
ncbi:MAG TPA: FKBP-type peptidyl-prolyl cis-trans isomerase [Thermoanaerobaculia bacterium]|jgi:peptidylprolyl isomerase|nr:FKBP-type peptidyl-prolyl cis-trans isomerase [Thermoanaerobaculia bacterium]